MKEKILKILLANTTIESRYTGGGEEPTIIAFRDSEDSDQIGFLSEMADKIFSELECELATQ